MRRLVAVLVALLLLAGCATVPTKGTIRSGSRQGLAPELGGVGVEAKPPRPGSDANGIVSGFLEAMSDSQAFDQAKLYMTPEAAANWHPEAQTIVYEQQPDQLAKKGNGIQLTAPKIATIDERGEWIPAAPGERADFFFKIKKVDGQLRVDSAPAGAMLGSNQVDLKLASRDLFFFNPSLGMLVPDPVYLPLNLSPGQAATQLIQELLKGPTSRLGNGVISLAPPGTEVQVSVPVDLGVATVALNDAAGSLRDQDRHFLAAQIVWTLNQISLRAKITVSGAPLLPDDPEILPFSDFNQYDPTAPAGSLTNLYGLQGGKVQRIQGLDGASNIAAQPLLSSQLHDYTAESFAVNLRGDSGAIVTTNSDGDEVVAYARLDSTDKPDEVKRIPVEGRTLTPTYDAQDNLWILDHADSSKPRLRVRGRDGNLSPVAVDFKGDAPLVLRMAPDGVRALLVMRSKSGKKSTYVETGTVQPVIGTKNVQLGQFRPLRLQLKDITDAAWNKLGILVIGTTTAPVQSAVRQAWQVNQDGSKLQQLPGSSQDFVATRVASNTNQDTLPVIQDKDGHVHWLSRDLSWVSMEPDGTGPTVIPTYPG
ncbi:LpqB family beta-propeller domain-containing protein [Kribbella sp. NPDC026611]|uniref:LpqB family beta-propeller domain-containing protein n=1 Tax=Kribbella sp. NPDC026611 TaxID=3154911 RepID=UPI0033E94F71